ncbi:inactive poly [ADP-ribose] polymerase SRO3 [Pyrus ussuriensis x Pyrus communis]|uniref:Inactive poly [ADP-ribose] polymerase SRO3 n=1 Tax=Pyrus ussuriensis x Pyrus communis TaxID=2448454 RepID=A0A5N5HCS0_9ROSA|nr:inactive poly [ADP-ribose] polymerase SRO3 [Pyrus ussuriensis x Pyrus communis]
MSPGTADPSLCECCRPIWGCQSEIDCLDWCERQTLIPQGVCQRGFGEQPRTAGKKDGSPSHCRSGNRQAKEKPKPTGSARTRGRSWEQATWLR